MPGRASGHQKLNPILVDRQLHDGDWSTSGLINDCEMAPQVGSLPWETSNSSLEWKIADVFSK